MRSINIEVRSANIGVRSTNIGVRSINIGVRSANIEVRSVNSGLYHQTITFTKLSSIRFVIIFSEIFKGMVSKISSGISVTVEVFYQPAYSNPLGNEYMFAYRIMIENHNNFTVKLLTRRWNIFDSNGEYREVEGEGVVGLQPVIEPGQEFQYTSGCNLRTEMGKMHGVYFMENQNNKQQFQVQIPAFEMIAPSKFN